MSLLIEPQLTKIKTILNTGMAAKLAAIALEYGDGVSLDAPVDDAYYINEIEAIPYLPAIQVIPDNSDIVLTGLRHDEMDHRIIVIAHVGATEGDTGLCAKRCYRFARAVWEIITAKRTLDDTVIEAFCTSINYKPMMSDNYTLKQEAWVSVTVKDEERI